MANCMRNGIRYKRHKYKITNRRTVECFECGKIVSHVRIVASNLVSWEKRKSNG